MGKPFQSELNQLFNIINWASNEGVQKIEPLNLNPAIPTYCVGSGGSQSAADFLARLIRLGNGFAWATTPLEYLNASCSTLESSTILLSASGKNKDILVAAQQSKQKESVLLAGVITRTGTPLASEITSYARSRVIELDIPSGKDGFLATNSLIAMMVAMLRLSPITVSGYEIEQWQRTASDVAESRNLPAFPYNDTEVIILFAGWGGVAALDLESKLSEAALAPSMICDVRSFGHGRHHWLAKRSTKSVIVTLEDGTYDELFQKTLALIPLDVPVIRLKSDCTGPAIAIDLTMKVFGLVQVIGTTLGIDPGRPGVPNFGRRIYHLSPTSRSHKNNESKNITAVVRRRMGSLPSDSNELLQRLELAASQFRQRISKTDIHALILDYDGTLVNTRNRFDSIAPKIVTELERLLATGMYVGIATGRGKSVREALRHQIHQKYWHRVLVGYYNASQIISLGEEKLPSTDIAPDSSLKELEKQLLQDAWLGTVDKKIDVRPQHLSISVVKCSSADLWMYIHQFLVAHNFKDYKCLSSAHSIDIMPFAVSKTAMIEAISLSMGCPQDGILCIGDTGRWPGNDCELLSHFPSLSSGTSPYDLSTGWNFAPAGVLESDATIFYLERLTGLNPMRLYL